MIADKNKDFKDNTEEKKLKNSTILFIIFFIFDIVDVFALAFTSAIKHNGVPVIGSREYSPVFVIFLIMGIISAFVCLCLWCSINSCLKREYSKEIEISCIDKEMEDTGNEEQKA